MPERTATLSESEQAASVADLARPYLWWEPVGDAPHGFARTVAQIMTLGSYDDILRLEAIVEARTLATVMRRAEPGWFDARSWEFWRGRLSFRIGADLANTLADTLAETPPRRRCVGAGDV